MAAVPSIGRASAVESRTSAPEAELTRELYERHGRQIYSYCLHQLGSREEAEDATQTTFMNAFRGLQRGVVPELESAWLFKIANNVILTRRRSSSRRRRVETPGDLDAIQDLLPSREPDADELIRLTDALGAMPEQQRKALLLREWQGLSYREIGDELGLSQPAVETLLFRARRSLAQGLTDPDARPRSGLRKALRSGFDASSVLAALQSLFSGGVAVKAAATAAVVASSAVVATDPAILHKQPQRQAKPVAADVARAPVVREATLDAPVAAAAEKPLARPRAAAKAEERGRAAKTKAKPVRARVATQSASRAAAPVTTQVAAPVAEQPQLPPAGLTPPPTAVPKPRPGGGADTPTPGRQEEQRPTVAATPKAPEAPKPAASEQPKTEVVQQQQPSGTTSTPTTTLVPSTNRPTIVSTETRDAEKDKGQLTPVPPTSTTQTQPVTVSEQIVVSTDKHTTEKPTATVQPVPVAESTQKTAPTSTTTQSLTVSTQKAPVAVAGS